MGSVFKKATGAGSQQASVSSNPASYINEIAGYEQVPVKNADGSITYVTRELELTPEEKAKKAELNQMANNALEELQKLSSVDYVASDSVQNLLNDWQSSQLDEVTESFSDRKEQEADRLAKRGLSDSTAANTVTRQTKQDEYDAKQSVSSQKSLIAENLRQQEMANQQTLYALAQDQLNYDAAQLKNSTSGNLSTINAINATNAASINDYYNSQALSTAQSNAFLTGLLDPLTSTATSTSSNALDSGVDGLVKTITGGFL